MDSNRHYRLNNNNRSYDHFHPNQEYYQQADKGKPQYIETTSDQILPPMEPPKTSSSFRSQPTAHGDEPPTDAEMNLLRKLRTLNGADYEAQYFDNKPTPNKETFIGKMGNPTALALAAFGLTNTLMSLFLMNVRGVKELNFLVGTMWFVAGMTNFICAIFELLVGNTFAWVIFGSLGGYFMSLGALLTPAFGVSAAYAKHPLEFQNAMGLFNCVWGAMFILFLIVSIRTNIFMVFIFVCVSTTVILMGIANFQLADGHKEARDRLERVAGVFLLLSSIPNWYLLFLILAASAQWPLAAKLPTGDLGAAKHGHGHGAPGAAAAHKKASPSSNRTSIELISMKRQ